ncbi:hypothetical protein V6N11_025790 [Hibiscus sabdariffa]|uniref:Retrovirus-related Pol polyprotein from transposon TNT 1-94 n=1 Tax=Hibiscus sabdariffa TaxID=183260 RepID=A0ABR2STQ2_9ROSI
MMALKYKEGKSTTDHVGEFQSVMNQLLGMGVKFDDKILGLWLLVTLPDSWEIFRVSLINSTPRGIITLDLAKSGHDQSQQMNPPKLSSTSGFPPLGQAEALPRPHHDSRSQSAHPCLGPIRHRRPKHGPRK